MARLPRLHLGSGRHYWPGYINIDLEDSADIKADIRIISGFQAIEIAAIHVIEHLNRWEVPDVLARWRSNLAPGGRLVLECPDWNKVLSHGDRDYILRGLYGDYRHRNELMSHRWCYSGDELKQLCLEAGFVSAEVMAPHFHKPKRDMRIEAYADH